MTQKPIEKHIPIKMFDQEMFWESMTALLDFVENSKNWNLPSRAPDTTSEKMMWTNEEQAEEYEQFLKIPRRNSIRFLVRTLLNLKIAAR